MNGEKCFLKKLRTLHQNLLNSFRAERGSWENFFKPQQPKATTIDCRHERRANSFSTNTTANWGGLIRLENSLRKFSTHQAVFTRKALTVGKIAFRRFDNHQANRDRTSRDWNSENFKRRLQTFASSRIYLFYHQRSGRTFYQCLNYFRI